LARWALGFAKARAKARRLFCFGFQVITRLVGFEEQMAAKPFAFSTELEQTQLLTQLLARQPEVVAT
jgi:hypothetical protein